MPEIGMKILVFDIYIPGGAVSLKRDLFIGSQRSNAIRRAQPRRLRFGVFRVKATCIAFLSINGQQSARRPA
jgi:hypothetical protein